MSKIVFKPITLEFKVFLSAGYNANCHIKVNDCEIFCKRSPFIFAKTTNSIAPLSASHYKCVDFFLTSKNINLLIAF